MSQYAGLLDTLREARRYVRRNPDEAIRLADEAYREMIGALGMGGFGLAVLLRRNLSVGARFIHCAPDVLKGYIDGAILEIQDHASREKK